MFFLRSSGAAGVGRPRPGSPDPRLDPLAALFVQTGLTVQWEQASVEPSAQASLRPPPSGKVQARRTHGQLQGWLVPGLHWLLGLGDTRSIGVGGHWGAWTVGFQVFALRRDRVSSCHSDWQLYHSATSRLLLTSHTRAVPTAAPRPPQPPKEINLNPTSCGLDEGVGLVL